MAEQPNPSLGSFVRLGKRDRKPGSPRLSWKLEASQQLSLTTPYPLMSTIHRGINDDNKARKCTFHWCTYSNAFTDKGFILVRHREDGSFERVPVDNTTGRVALPEESTDSLVIAAGCHNADLHDLAPGQQTTTRRLDLPERYYRALREGETYSLVFPGTEVGMWAWGNIEDNTGLEMKAGRLLSSGYRSRPRAKKGQGQPRLVMPGGTLVTFSVVEEKVAWPERAARESKVGFSMANLEEQSWRWTLQQTEKGPRKSLPAPLIPSNRIPGAPIFSASLRCPQKLRGRGYLDVEVTITFEGLQGDNDRQMSETLPVTFHWLSLVSGQGEDNAYQLYRRRRDDGAGDTANESSLWDPCEIEETSAGFMVVDEPDVAVRVGHHKHFTSLRPGETWTTTETLSGNDTELPGDLAPGDVFRYTFEGTVVDWWDWGTMEDHSETIVKLPCYEAGTVTEPADNGGRPKLVVPAAEPVEFMIE